jgi:hypothetical protein
VIEKPFTVPEIEIISKAVCPPTIIGVSEVVKVPLPDTGPPNKAWLGAKPKLKTAAEAAFDSPNRAVMANAITDFRMVPP